MWRKALLIFIGLLVGGGIAFYFYGKKTKPILTEKAKQSFDNLVSGKAVELASFIKYNKYNDQYVFIVNMAVPSSQARFYIYDMWNKKIVQKGLVCHGKGSDVDGKFIFNNIISGGASSKGKYKIGNKYNGQFGLAYKLYGLENSNSNAYARFVVLHAHNCVPSGHSYSKPICRSDGCPTVAPSFLAQCASIIDTSPLSILLYIDYFAA